LPNFLLTFFEYHMLGSVDLCRLNFVQSKSVLIAASEMCPSHLSEFHSINRKTLLDEPAGQRLLTISTTLSPIYVEQPHCIGSALYKEPTNSCKNNLERSADPNHSQDDIALFMTFTYILMGINNVI